MEKHIISNYHFNRITQIQLIKKDKVHVYRLMNDNEVYYFRVYDKDKSHEKLLKEVQVLEYLSSKLHHVERVIRAKNGENILRLEDDKLAVLYKEVKGQVDLEPSDEKLISLVSDLKKIHHDLLEIEHIKYDFFNIDQGLKAFINDKLDLSEDALILYNKILDFYKENQIRYKLLFNIGICHGDLHLENVLFDNEKAGLIDFDYVCKTYQVYDLATLIWTIMPRNNNQPVTSIRDKCRLMIDQYLGVKDKDYPEKSNLIYGMILVRHIWRQWIRVDYKEFQSDHEMNQMFIYQAGVMKKWIDDFEIQLES